MTMEMMTTSTGLTQETRSINAAGHAPATFVCRAQPAFAHPMENAGLTISISQSRPKKRG